MTDELFVKDFVQRLRTTPYLLPVFEFDKNVSAAASDEQLKRFYANNLNLIYLGFRIFIAMETDHRSRLKPEGSSDDAGFEPTLAGFEAMMPRELIELVSNDPVVGSAYIKAIEEERQNEAKARNAQQNEQSNLVRPDDTKPQNDSSGEDDLSRISTMDRMNHYNGLIEKAAAIVRKRLKEMQPDLAPDLATAIRVWSTPKDEPPPEEPINISRENDVLGYPRNAKVLSTSLFYLHIDMIKDYDGQLRIAAVHIIDD